MRCGPLDLIRIVVQTHDIATRESRNLPCWLADTTPNIENSHRIIDIDSVRKVVLMASESLQQRFARRKAAKMERLRPAFFVEVGDEVVVTR